MENNFRRYLPWLNTDSKSVVRQKPKLYTFFQVNQVQLHHSRELVQWMDLYVEYENHSTKLNYVVELLSHEADESSFEIWLPSQFPHFFVTLRFESPKDNVLLGRAFAKVDISSSELEISKKLECEILLNNQVVGHCFLSMRFEQNVLMT